MLFKHNLQYGKFFSPDGAGSGAGSSEGGDSGAGESGGDESAADDKSEGNDLDGLKSALDKERKAARDASKALKALQTELETIRNAGKSDEEKRDADLKAALDRATAAEEKAQRTSGQAAIFKAAADSISPEAVYALAEKRLEFNDDAEPTNVDDVLADIKKSNPKLFPAARGTADGGKVGDSKYEPLPGTDRMRHAYETSDKAAKR